MSEPKAHAPNTNGQIRRLPEGTVNRIAAGEVIERPSSVVKELVENAIDAGAQQIEVIFQDGGRSLIRVSDDGCGMSDGELQLAIERHATSKLPDDDLVHITKLGFRGEALASIGSVARLKITSRAENADEAYEVRVEGGHASSLRPAARRKGTELEVRDLFYAVPARLKFLKSERSELAEVTGVMRRVAMAHPEIGFVLVAGERQVLDLKPHTGPDHMAQRIAATMGQEFIDNAVAIEAGRDMFQLTGFAGLATYGRAQANMQFLFVNGRPVRDKTLTGALRGAYRDVMMRMRHPVAVLFITCPPEFVDVNVHPAKAEVRFRDSALISSLIAGSIRHTLGLTGPRTASTIADETLKAFQTGPTPLPAGQTTPAQPSFAQAPAQVFAGFDSPSADIRPADEVIDDGLFNAPLGAARAQFHENYILAQTRDGVVIVDQHAAHERLVYERMKNERERSGITRQPLLVPEVVDLDPARTQLLLAHSEELAAAGLVVDGFGPSSIVVREVPSVLTQAKIIELIKDVADDLESLGTGLSLGERLDHVLATMACHGSVRSGRRLKPEEMNQLLRDIEATPNASQCNHGRPTYVALKLSDIERLFSRR